MVDQET
jgi:hypothetical protein